MTLMVPETPRAVLAEDSNLYDPNVIPLSNTPVAAQAETIESTGDIFPVTPAGRAKALSGVPLHALIDQAPVALIPLELVGLKDVSPHPDRPLYQKVENVSTLNLWKLLH